LKNDILFSTSKRSTNIYLVDKKKAREEEHNRYFVLCLPFVALGMTD
jgi:hypothetical protein